MKRLRNWLGNASCCLLQQWRMLAQMGAIILFASVAILYLPRPMAERLLRDDMVNRAHQWETRLETILDGGRATFATGRIAARDKASLALFLRASDVFRMRLFDRRGRIFWSSRPDEIGRTLPEDSFATVAATGRYVYAQDETTVARIDGFRQDNPDSFHRPGDRRLVAEITVPVLERGQFQGAVEFYRDITTMHASFVARMRTALAAFAGIGVVLSCGIILFIVLNDQKRMRLMRENAVQEQVIMEQQKRAAREIRMLSSLNEWLQSSNSLDELFSMVSAFMGRLLPDCAGSIYVYSNSRDVLDGACQWNGAPLHAHIRPDSCWGLRRGRTYAYGQGEIDFACEHVTGPGVGPEQPPAPSPGIPPARPGVPARENPVSESRYQPWKDGRPYFCFPVLAHGETVGLMHLAPCAGVSTETFVAVRNLGQMCAEQISLAIANVQLRDQLHHQSVRDPLTGLFNRRHFLENLRRHIDAARHEKGAVSLISIDVDHFKAFNDNHGHDAGDMVLRAVGETLERLCDGDEIPCRMGGEEFIALLPDAGMKAALAKAEQLRKAIAAIKIRYGEKTLPRITISAGVSTWPADGAMPQDLIKAADNALYEAKARGRNRVCPTAGATRENRAKDPNQEHDTRSGRAAAGGKREPSGGDSKASIDAGAVDDPTRTPPVAGLGAHGTEHPAAGPIHRDKVANSAKARPNGRSPDERLLTTRATPAPRPG